MDPTPNVLRPIRPLGRTEIPGEDCNAGGRWRFIHAGDDPESGGPPAPTSLFVGADPLLHEVDEFGL